MFKKAQEGGSFGIIKTAIIVLLVLTILIFVFVKYFGQEIGIVQKNICGVDHDEDGDGIPDIADRCPCDTGEPSECKTPKQKCQSQIDAKCKVKKA